MRLSSWHCPLSSALASATAPVWPMPLSGASQPHIQTAAVHPQRVSINAPPTALQPAHAHHRPKAWQPQRKAGAKPSSASCGKTHRLTFENEALQLALPALQCLGKRHCTCVADAVAWRIPAAHPNSSSTPATGQHQRAAHRPPARARTPPTESMAAATKSRREAQQRMMRQDT